MAETAESVSTPETKKFINPRVEIDTSPPFESVKEAVDRFGGSGPWIPLHLLRLAAAHNDNGVFDVEKMEEQALKLEKDLIVKEQETLNVMRELEATRRFIEDMKVNLMTEMSSFVSDSELESHMPVPKENSTEEMGLCHVVSPCSMVLELNQAKLNLNKTSVDLALIQASVESLNQKLRKDKVLLERRSRMQIQNLEVPMSLNKNCAQDADQKLEAANGFDFYPILSEGLKQENYEAEQFKKMTEASRYEVMKAIMEIEQTKNSIKMAEMRLNAAKKMEEAAKAVRAIALAEKKALLNGENSPEVLMQNSDGITLSFEEFQMLTQKAKQAEELCKTKFIDTNGLQRANDASQLKTPILEKFEETPKETKRVHFFNNGNAAAEHCFSGTHMESDAVQWSVNNSTKFRFRNSHSGHRNGDSLCVDNKPSLGSKSTTSMGDVLSKKFVVQDDVVMGRHIEDHSERQHVSLSQMLRKQSKLILNPSKPKAAVERKKFGFIQVGKQSKKKGQPQNLR